MFRKIHIVLLGVVACWLLLFRDAGATIVLFGNETISYPSMDASFTPPIPEAGLLGEVYAAEPSNGCSALDVNVTGMTAFAIFRRGECSFEDKVRNGQSAGYTAVIVFDKDEHLVTMKGKKDGITTYALFVSKEAGEKLLSIEGSVYLLPGYRRTTWAIQWLIFSVSLVVVVIVGAVVTALCCIRQHILSEAEKDALNEKLLQSNDDLLSREFIPDDPAPAAVAGQEVMTDTDGEVPSDTEQPSENTRPALST